MTRSFVCALLAAAVASFSACSTTSSSTPSDDGGTVTDGGNQRCTGSERITFQLKAIANTFCTSAGSGCTGDQFVSVKRSDGTSPGDVHRNCQTLCADCEPVACDLSCAVSTLLSDTGVTTLWDGSFFSRTSSTCGSGLACVDAACASAGEYIATFCGYALPESDAGADAGSVDPYQVCQGIPANSTPTCVDVPFTWPAPEGTVVVGTLAK